jgi:transcriptional regulator with XRE-family HTH domain
MATEPNEAQKIAAMIHTLRDRENMTQVALAEKAGTTQACVSRIEAGVDMVTLPMLKSVLGGLGYSLRLVVSRKLSEYETTL